MSSEKKIINRLVRWFFLHHQWENRSRIFYLNQKGTVGGPRWCKGYRIFWWLGTGGTAVHSWAPPWCPRAPSWTRRAANHWRWDRPRKHKGPNWGALLIFRGCWGGFFWRGGRSLRSAVAVVVLINCCPLNCLDCRAVNPDYRNWAPATKSFCHNIFHLLLSYIMKYNTILY